MLVLDGVPLALGFLNSINPNDIADVTILKSSSSTAIYGPDGVNGAIVVTTKRGNKARPSITVSHTTQLEKISYLPKFQTIYGGGYSQDAYGDGIWEPIEQQSWGDPFDGSIRQFGQTGPNGEKLEMPYSYNKNGRRNSSIPVLPTSPTFLIPPAIFISAPRTFLSKELCLVM